MVWINALLQSLSLHTFGLCSSQEHQTHPLSTICWYNMSASILIPISPEVSYNWWCTDRCNWCWHCAILMQYMLVLCECARLIWKKLDDERITSDYTMILCSLPPVLLFSYHSSSVLAACCLVSLLSEFSPDWVIPIKEKNYFGWISSDDVTF